MSSALKTVRAIREQRYFKISFLYSVTLFASFMFWFLMKANFDFVFLSSQGLNHLFLGLFALLFFAFFLATFAQTISILSDFHLIFGLIGLVNIPYFFIFGFNLLGFGGFLILLLCFYVWAERIKRYEKFHKNFNPVQSGLSGMRTTIMILLIVIAFSFYIDVTKQGQTGYFLGRLERYGVSLTNGSLHFLLANYDPKMPADDFLKLLLKNKVLQKFSLVAQTKRLSPAEKVAIMRTGIEKRFKIKLRNKQAGDLVTVFIHEYITVTLMRYQKFFPEAAALAFFLFLRLFYWVYYFLIRGFLWLWLKILLRIKIIKCVKENITVERFILS